MQESQNISNTIFKFANSFDAKDWQGLKSVLANSLTCDYMSLRGVIETLSPEEYVQKRITALDHLRTQHFMSNLEIYFDQENKDQAHCRALSMIYRNKDGFLFNTHAMYEFKLAKNKIDGSPWLISWIKQEVLWNDGDPFLHSGAKAAQG